MQDTSRTARGLSSLLEMGFERAAPPAPTAVEIPVGRTERKMIVGRPAMGTVVRVTAMTASRDRAEEAIGRAFDELDRLVAIFSRYERSSAITQLNHAGRMDGAPPELTRVMTRALHYHRLTRGGFDVSVAPLVDLLRERPDRLPPPAPDVAAALALVGSQHVEVSRRRIGFRREGMRVTLDGIAKGHIVDAFAHVLERHHIRDYLIDAGGDIRVSGTKEGKRPWMIAVQDPAKQGRFPDAIVLRGGAVATSGGYEHYFDRDQLVHHIVDAGTGMSPRHSVSVSVVAPTAMAADALATSVFLMEPRRGVAFIDGLRGCECLIVDRNGGQFRSRGWRSAGVAHEAEAEA
jgi:thiamine biosynthesis lipoprotein